MAQLWPSAVFSTQVIQAARKYSTSGMGSQMLMCIMASAHARGNLAQATLLGHSLGVRHAKCVSGFTETSSQGIRAVFGVDPRVALPAPTPACQDQEKLEIVRQWTCGAIGGDWQAHFVATAAELQGVPRSRLQVPCFDCSSMLDEVFRGLWLSDLPMMARRPLDSVAPEQFMSSTSDHFTATVSQAWDIGHHI